MKYILVYQTDNFVVEVPTLPHISREEGGHLRIKPKKHYNNRCDLPQKEAIEVMRLTMIVGEAFKTAMNKLGIPVLRINYYDMGNWAFKTNKEPFFHIHVYGRAVDSTVQVWPEAISLPARETGFYENFEHLNDEDIEEIKRQIDIVLKSEKYTLWK